MHAREIVELAGLVAEHGPALVCGEATISQASLNQYWLASKNRCDAWSRALKRFSLAVPGPGAGDHRLAGLVREILAAEVLTRVWTTALAGYDRRRGQGDIEPIARSVFLGQLEVRNRALALLVHAPGVHVETAVALNRLRQRAERWTDLLVGRLAIERGTSDFAHDPARAGEFADDLRRHDQRTDRHAWPILLGSLRAAFRDVPCAAPHAALNQRVAAAILACFPAELFDGSGVLPSLWLVRLASAAADAQGMIAELVDQHDRPPASLPGGRDRFPRQR